MGNNRVRASTRACTNLQIKHTSQRGAVATHAINLIYPRVSDLCSPLLRPNWSRARPNCLQPFEYGGKRKERCGSHRRRRRRCLCRTARPLPPGQTPRPGEKDVYVADGATATTKTTATATTATMVLECFGFA